MSYPKNGMSRGFQSDMEAHTSTTAEDTTRDATLGYAKKAIRDLPSPGEGQVGEGKLTVEIMEEVRRSGYRASVIFMKLDELKSRLFGAPPEEASSDGAKLQTEPEEFSWAIRYRLRTLSQQLDELERVADALIQRL